MRALREGATLAGQRIRQMEIPKIKNLEITSEESHEKLKQGEGAGMDDSPHSPPQSPLPAPVEPPSNHEASIALRNLKLLPDYSSEYNSEHIDINLELNDSSEFNPDSNEQEQNEYTRQPPISKSAKLSSLQSLFSDSQKIAYVGLCYLLIANHKSQRLLAGRRKDLREALAAYHSWSSLFLARLYICLDVSDVEQDMIASLAAHGVTPADLASSLVAEARDIIKASEPPSSLQAPISPPSLSSLEIQNLESLADSSLFFGVEEPLTRAVDIKTPFSGLPLCEMSTESPIIDPPLDFAHILDSPSSPTLTMNPDKLTIVDTDIPLSVVIPDGAPLSESLLLDSMKPKEPIPDLMPVAQMNHFETKAVDHNINSENLQNALANVTEPFDQEETMKNVSSNLSLDIPDRPLTPKQEEDDFATSPPTRTTSLSPLTPQPLHAADPRYTILAHLFLNAIADGTYTSYARTLLRRIATTLECEPEHVFAMERALTQELRLHSIDEGAKIVSSEESIVLQSKRERKRRMILMGVATLSGGLVIGLTAGLAAPFIGAGMAAAFGAVGVSGTAGFLTGIAGVATITSTGVLAGSGMSTYHMHRRTKDVQEFEVIENPPGDGEEKYLDEEDPRRVEWEAKEKLKEERRKARLEKSRNVSKTKTPVDNPSSSSKTTSSTPAELLVTLEDTESEAPPPYQEPEDPNLLSLSVAKPITEIEHEFEPAETPTSPLPRTTSLESIPSMSARDSSSSCLSLASRNSLESLDTVVQRRAAKDCTRPPSAIISIAGWLTNGLEDYWLPFSVLSPLYGDHYSLVWESSTLLQLGGAIKIFASEVITFSVQQVIQMTVLPALMAALTGPLWAMKLSYFVDNPWGVGLTKSRKAGLILADMLCSNAQSGRPVTLIGFSLGARVIFYCLLELASRKAYGLIEQVYLIGTPVTATEKDWILIASVVSDRIVNGYTTTDWLLSVIFRSGNWGEVPGLMPVKEIPGLEVENIDLTSVVNGHLAYRLAIPRILKMCGLKVTKTILPEEEEMIAEEAEKKAEEERKKTEKEKAKEKNKKPGEETPAPVFSDGEEPSETSFAPISSTLTSNDDESKQEPSIKKKQSFWWFKRSNESINTETATPTDSQISKDQAVEHPTDNPTEDELDEAFTPREIRSSLPPLKLVLKSEEPGNDEAVQGVEGMPNSAVNALDLDTDNQGDDQNETIFGDSDFVPREIESSLPTLVINSLEGLTRPSKSFNSSALDPLPQASSTIPLPDDDHRFRRHSDTVLHTTQSYSPELLHGEMSPFSDSGLGTESTGKQNNDLYTLRDLKLPTVDSELINPWAESRQ